jgi:hypothetical protein
MLMSLIMKTTIRLPRETTTGLPRKAMEPRRKTTMRLPPKIMEHLRKTTTRLPPKTMKAPRKTTRKAMKPPKKLLRKSPKREERREERREETREETREDAKLAEVMVAKHPRREEESPDKGKVPSVEVAKLVLLQPAAGTGMRADAPVEVQVLVPSAEAVKEELLEELLEQATDTAMLADAPKEVQVLVPSVEAGEGRFLQVQADTLTELSIARDVPAEVEVMVMLPNATEQVSEQASVPVRVTVVALRADAVGRAVSEACLTESDRLLKKPWTILVPLSSVLFPTCATLRVACVQVCSRESRKPAMRSRKAAAGSETL